jgi:hypothetical protein
VLEKSVSNLQDYKVILSLLRGTDGNIKPEELQMALSLLFANLGLSEKSDGSICTFPWEIASLFSSGHIPLNIPVLYQEEESAKFLATLMEWVKVVDYDILKLTTPDSHLDRGTWYAVKNDPTAKSLFILGNHNNGLVSQKVVALQYSHYTGLDPEDRLLITLPILLLSEILLLIMGTNLDPIYASHPILLAETDNHRPVFAQRMGLLKFRLITSVPQTFGIRTASPIR